MGGIDFKDYFIALRATDLTSLDAVKKAGVPVIAYGQFLNTVFNFLIVAFAIFLLVKTGEPVSEACSCRDQGLPILLQLNSSQSEPVPELHFGSGQDGHTSMTIHRIAVLMLASSAAFAFDAQSELLANLADTEKKIVSLAEAVPAEKYSWRPMEGVRSVGEVYMHIAGANYMIPAALGAKAPAGISRDMEKTVTDKAKIIEHLKQSFAHVRQAIESSSDNTKADKTVRAG